MRTMSVVVALVLLGAVTEARDLQQNTETVARKCTYPQNGTWEVEHYLPIGGGDVVLGIRSYLVLQEDFPGIYSGSGGGIILIDGAVPAGTPLSYLFLGVFEAGTCSLSGTIVNFEAEAFDAISWQVVDKNKIEGIAANYASGNVTFPYYGRHELTYIG